MDDDTLDGLMNDAQMHSACALGTCRLNAAVHQWWFVLTHSDPPRESHTRVVSVYTLLEMKREALVQATATWVDRLHAQDLAPLGDRRGAPRDARSGCPSAPLDGPGDVGAADGRRGDRVGAGPRD